MSTYNLSAGVENINKIEFKIDLKFIRQNNIKNFNSYKKFSNAFEKL